MKLAYYNEIDPYAARWLRNLIAAGHIAAGDVDERSIEDVRPDDLRGYAQCHFFAGIGVWSYALRLAGWDDDRSVWTGSCPCQPFSAAGKGVGFADERHLWPAFGHLIREHKPAAVFGEQVASKDAEPWLDLVHTDLEAMGYAFGAIAFPSAGIGAPHIRDRTYWMGISNSAGRKPRRIAAQAAGQRSALVAAGDVRGMADTDNAIGRADAAARHECHGQDACRKEGAGDIKGCRDLSDAGPINGFWRSADWLGCTDGKWRPVEPGTFPLVNGATGRVGRLRAYGNAINAQAAAEFIRSAI